LVIIGPVTTTVSWLMSTFFLVDTICVLRMLMHLRLGHVTLLHEEFGSQIPPIGLTDLRTHVELCRIFLVCL